MNTQAKYRIIIVDDHLLFSQSLELLINSFEKLEVIRSFQNGKDFIKFQLENKHIPVDLVLMDGNIEDAGIFN